MKMKNTKYSQNFITSKKHIDKILKQLNITKDDNIIEIGAGKGHFTEALSKISHSVVAIEIDQKLAAKVKQKLKHIDHFTLKTMDILKYRFPDNDDYIIFGNIPYHLSTEIVKKIAKDSNNKDTYLIVEKGFAKRINNLNRAFGLLLAVEFKITTLQEIPRTYFHPVPNVDSVLIKLERQTPLVPIDDYPLYKYFVYSWVNKEYRTLFTNKQFKRAIQYAQLKDINNYSIDQFISIFNSYKLFN